MIIKISKKWLLWSLYLFIYLSGCIATYHVAKETVVIEHKRKAYPVTYSTGDRTIVLFISATSWVGFLASTVSYLSETGNNTPANW